MLKGFINYKDGRIPFVSENYHMHLFTDDSILSEFKKEYNNKTNYVLFGEEFEFGVQSRRVIFFVEHLLGYTCYLHSYIIAMVDSNIEYDSIGFQSSFLDDIFRYKYVYLDLVRSGVNLAIETRKLHSFKFNANSLEYDLSYVIGNTTKLGLLESFDKKGEVIVTLHKKNIEECNMLSTILCRLSKFMTSDMNVSFSQITLYKNGIKTGWLFTPNVNDQIISFHDMKFHDYDVDKFTKKIIQNIATDYGNVISNSVPLGHLKTHETLFSPHRFLEQISSFEYLFEKLEPQKAKDKKIPLVDELKLMINEFPNVLSNIPKAVEDICKEIKTRRVNIVHGYEYYYDFQNDILFQRYMILLDELLKKMSLKLIGFSNSEIDELRSTFIM